MYFYKIKGRPMLDMRGDLVITHNKGLVMSRVSSAAPRYVKNAKYIELQKLSFFQKIKASFIVIGFIWGENQELIPDNEGL